MEFRGKLAAVSIVTLWIRVVMTDCCWEQWTVVEHGMFVSTTKGYALNNLVLMLHSQCVLIAYFIKYCGCVGCSALIHQTTLTFGIYLSFKFQVFMDFFSLSKQLLQTTFK
jgi:hypothetical protein